MKTRLLTGLLAACIAVVLISCNGGNSTMESPKKIEVTGSAEMEFVPDEIYVTFTMKEYLDASKKKVKIENIKTDFLALCKTAGVPDSSISISSYTGDERWDYYWYRRRRSEPDFMSSVSFTVKVNSPDKIDKIVANLNEKAIDNFYISKTSHSNIEQLRKEVKIKALIAGKAKADYLVKSIGEELGEALLIQEIENSYSSYYANESNVSNKTSQSSEIIVDGIASGPNFQRIKLRYEMKVEFRLK